MAFGIFRQNNKIMQNKNISKKNIIVFIRRGVLELEWISPILEKFYYSKYNIFFYFKSKSVFNM